MIREGEKEFLKSKAEKKSAQHRLSSMWQQNENKGRPADEGKTGLDRSVCFSHGCLTESWSHHRSHSFQISVLSHCDSQSVSDGVYVCVCVVFVATSVREQCVSSLLCMSFEKAYFLIKCCYGQHQRSKSSCGSARPQSIKAPRCQNDNDLVCDHVENFTPAMITLKQQITEPGRCYLQKKKKS